MPILLASIAKQILSEGGKLFGPRAQRVTTAEMNAIYSELKAELVDNFSKFNLSKALPSKSDHGDIDIIVSGKEGTIANTLKSVLGNNVIEYHKNGNIYSILYHSPSLNKTVHVDFINSSEEDYSMWYDYLSYGDFSAMIGILCRPLHFNYGSTGFFKVYTDKKGQFHYILITKNLREGLMILGYGGVIKKYDEIKTPDDIANFIASSDLFDSDYFAEEGFNHTDRKRIRGTRKIAGEIKDKLRDMDKRSKQPDEDHFLKTIFPSKYAALLAKEQEIETAVIPKSIYDGKWLMTNFPEIKPGPIISKIKSALAAKFGDKLDTAPESEVKSAVLDLIKKPTA